MEDEGVKETFESGEEGSQSLAHPPLPRGKLEVSRTRPDSSTSAVLLLLAVALSKTSPDVEIMCAEVESRMNNRIEVRGFNVACMQYTHLLKAFAPK